MWNNSKRNNWQYEATIKIFFLMQMDRPLARKIQVQRVTGMQQKKRKAWCKSKNKVGMEEMKGWREKRYQD